MGFFSHAAMLGVGYWIGKSYCFRYKVQQLPSDPDASEILFRVERKEGMPTFWGHPWWNHHGCWHTWHQQYHQNEKQRVENVQTNNTTPEMKNE